MVNKIKPLRNAELKPKSFSLFEKIAVIFFGLVLIILTAGGVRRCYQQMTATGPYRQNLSGKILDKYTKTIEDYEGSFYSRRLLIEEKNGNLVRLPVSEKVWQEAKVGYWFIRDKHGVRFSALEPRPSVDLPPSPNAMHTP